MSTATIRRKTYAIEERMAGDWIERWSGFPSFKAAMAFARRIDSQCHGQLRIVHVLRTPMPIITDAGRKALAESQ